MSAVSKTSLATSSLIAAAIMIEADTDHRVIHINTST